MLGKKGKARIERTYVGDLHRHRMTDVQWIFLKLGYALLYLLAAVLYLIGTTQDIAPNYVWYVQVAQAVGIVSLFALLYCLVCYLTSHRELDNHSYNLNTVFFKSFCMITAVTTALAALLQLPVLILNGEGFGSAKVVLAYLLPCIPPLLFLLLWTLEAKVIRYDKILGKDAPYDSIRL